MPPLKFAAVVWGKVITRKILTVIAGISFGEAPRWHDGALYLSDIHADRVLRVNPAGTFEVVAQLQKPVSGLGWLPDGRMLVVCMHERKVLRQESNGSMIEHADISSVATWYANDMVVAADGTAYVGNFGFQITPVRAQPCTAAIACITPAGDVSVAAEGLWFPNGMVISPDGHTMVVAESAARRLSAFDITQEGSLVNPRVWGQMGPNELPDGICLDAEGAIWVASPPTREVLRMREGGEILERIEFEQEAIACMLGGPDRSTLFILTAASRDPEWCRRNHTARVLAVQVDVPGAGWP